MAKYSKKAGEKVEEAMLEMKHGELKSGSGQKVTSRKQAVAIGLSEARESGAKVPPPKQAASKKAAKKSAGKKAAPKKQSAKKAAPKKHPASKKAASKKTPAKKGTKK